MVDSAREDDPPPPTGWRDPRLRQALSVMASVLIVGGIFWFVLGQFSDRSLVWASMRSLTGAEMALLAVAAHGTCAPTSSSSCWPRRG